MRPRVFPAETCLESGGSWAAASFNEAAGIPRGRPERVAQWIDKRDPLQ